MEDFKAYMDAHRPVTLGKMIAALRYFSQHSENDYERLIMTETANRLEQHQEARRRAVHQARYMPQTVKVKPRKVAHQIRTINKKPEA